MRIREIARLAHEVVRAYGTSADGFTIPPWELMTEKYRDELNCAVAAHMSIAYTPKPEEHKLYSTMTEGERTRYHLFLAVITHTKKEYSP